MNFFFPSSYSFFDHDEDTFNSHSQPYGRNRYTHKSSNLDDLFMSPFYSFVAPEPTCKNTRNAPLERENQKKRSKIHKRENKQKESLWDLLSDDSIDSSDENESPYKGDDNKENTLTEEHLNKPEMERKQEEPIEKEGETSKVDESIENSDEEELEVENIKYIKVSINKVKNELKLIEQEMKLISQDNNFEKRKNRVLKCDEYLTRIIIELDSIGAIENEHWRIERKQLIQKIQKRIDNLQIVKNLLNKL